MWQVFLKTIFVLVSIFWLVACASSHLRASPAEKGAYATMDSSNSVSLLERKLVWQANVSIRVASVQESSENFRKLAESKGGYVESASGNNDKDMHLLIRIPVAEFKPLIEMVESSGEVTYRSVSAEDVTEQYIDIDSRIKNKILLRDQLLTLLKSAKSISDIVAIQKELNQVQSDLDSMQGQLKSMRGQIEFSKVDLNISRIKIRGPVGHVLDGLSWIFEKLLYIRD